MPFQKGHKFSPGRPKGSKNKYNATIQETVQRLGINVFEGICLFAMGDWKRLGYEAECYFSEGAAGMTKLNYVISPEMRLTALLAAAKYIYSPMQASQLVPLIEVSNEEQRKKIEELKVEYQTVRVDP